MEGQNIRGLIEAYSQVYEAPEVLNEEVEDLHEIGVNFGGQAAVNKARAEQKAKTASDAKLSALRQQRFGSGGSPSAGRNSSGNRRAGQNDNVFKPTPGAGSASGQGGRRGSGSSPGSLKPAAPAAAAKPAAPAAAAKPAAPAAAAKPAAPAAAAKPAATSAPKPVPTPAKPAGSAMDQWAKANPKLAAAKAERDRTRGTSATTNPLMKDMKSSMPAPKAPAPSTASTGFGLAKKGVNLAAGVDIFDLVKGHLLDEGYADSEDAAMVIMVNMSEEWRKSILEAHGVEILDEAQEARENPEKHEEEKEKEDEKKYGKVRGEKTPMPPRGDKRREDFEKWYAANVR